MTDEDSDLDDDGYPTERALERVQNWTPPYKHLMVFLETLWWCGEAYVETPNYVVNGVYEFRLHTAGWSGNEQLMGALEANPLFWGACWVQSRRGGHYIFEIPVSLYESKTDG